MSQQQQISPPPAAVQAPAPPSAPPTDVSASGNFWGRFAIPLFAVLAAFAFIALATLRWDEWVGGATVQTTNDAYIRAELTRLSSRVAGEVLTVAVTDFQHVKAGDLLVQIDPADYQAQVAQAEAGVAAAQAALDNLNNQVELQYATIAQAEAQQVSAAATEVEARQEQERQQSLSQTEAGTRQKLEQATAAYAKAQADVRASRAVIAAQRHQLEVLSGPRSSVPPISRAPRRRSLRRNSSSATPGSWRRSMASPASGRCSPATTSISAPTSSTWCRCRRSM